MFARRTKPATRHPYDTRPMVWRWLCAGYVATVAAYLVAEHVVGVHTGLGVTLAYATIVIVATALIRRSQHRDTAFSDDYDVDFDGDSD